MSNIVQLDYQGQAVQLNDDGWFNATVAAEKFGKRPVDWLNQIDTAHYLAALYKRHTGKSDFVEQFIKIKEIDNSSSRQSKLLRLSKATGYVKTKQGPSENGGGTWLHPKLAVVFARWLDLDFAVWCDEQIDALLRGKDNSKNLRHEAAVSFKVMNAVLLFQRQRQGKTTQAHHFGNEARMINFVLTGEFKPLDRSSLPASELDLLAKLEEQNTVLIGNGLSYEDRKTVLQQFAASIRQPQRLESV